MDWNSEIMEMTRQILDNLLNVIKLGLLVVIIGLFVWRLGKYILDRVIAGNFIASMKELKDRVVQKISEKKRGKK